MKCHFSADTVGKAHVVTPADAARECDDAMPASTMQAGVGDAEAERIEKLDLYE